MHTLYALQYMYIVYQEQLGTIEPLTYWIMDSLVSVLDTCHLRVRDKAQMLYFEKIKF